MKKKLFAIVMSVTTVLSFMPTMAFAGDTHEHSYGGSYNYERKEATCTEDGEYEWYGCAGCEMVQIFRSADDEVGFWGTMEDTVIPAHHVEGETVEAVTPDCTNTGNPEYTTCKNCDEMIKIDDEWVPYTEANLSANGHKVGEAHEGQTLTCDKDGYPAYVECKNCDAVSTNNGQTWYDDLETITTKSTGHVKGEKVSSQQATCDHDGNLTYIPCKNCDKVMIRGEWVDASKAVIAGGHVKSAEAVEAVPATCTTDGNVKYFTCENCEKVLYKTKWVNKEDIVVPAHHVEDVDDEQPEVAPTCTKAGHKAYIGCTGCDMVKVGDEWVEPAQAEIPAKGHTEGTPEKEVVKAATCTEGGLYNVVIKCTECGDVVRSITNVNSDAKRHDMVHVAEEKATAFHEGHTAGLYCAACGEVSTEQKTIDKVSAAKSTVAAGKKLAKVTVKSVNGAVKYTVTYKYKTTEKTINVKVGKNTIKKLKKGKKYAFTVKAYDEDGCEIVVAKKTVKIK